MLIIQATCQVNARALQRVLERFEDIGRGNRIAPTRPRMATAKNWLSDREARMLPLHTGCNSLSQRSGRTAITSR